MSTAASVSQRLYLDAQRLADLKEDLRRAASLVDSSGHVPSITRAAASLSRPGPISERLYNEGKRHGDRAAERARLAREEEAARLRLESVHSPAASLRRGRTARLAGLSSGAGDAGGGGNDAGGAGSAAAASKGTLARSTDALFRRAEEIASRKEALRAEAEAEAARLRKPAVNECVAVALRPRRARRDCCGI